MSNLSGLKSSLNFRNPFVLILCGGLIGRCAWSGHTYALPLSLLIMPLIRPAETRRNRWLLFAAYYAGSTWPIVPGSALFYGYGFNPLVMVPLWLAVAFFLAAPWALICSGETDLRLGWSIPLCFLIQSIPPYAMFSLANPLVSAGVVFPKWGVAGLVTLVILSVVLAIRPLGGLVFLAGLVCIGWALVPDAEPPNGWAAVNTKFSGAGVDAPDILTQYNVAQSVQQLAISTKGTVLIFPESIIYRWSPVTDLFWKETIASLRTSGKTIIVGAVMDLSGRDRYLNVAVVRGDTTNALQQRIPMPVSLWKPLTNTGVPLNLYGPGTVAIHGERATILICYEQLLVWPMLRSVREHPTVIVGMANEYWSKYTYAEAIQASALESWGRLFDIPVVSAVNR
jgi:hypothetical protein